MSRYLDYISPAFLFFTGDRNIVHQVPGFPFVGPALAGLFLIGIGISLYRLVTGVSAQERRQYVYIIASFLAFPVPASLTVDRMHVPRTLHVMVLVFLFAGIGMKTVLSYVGVRMRTALIVLLLVGNTVSFAVFIRQYFGPYAYALRSQWVYAYGIREAFRYLADTAAGNGRVDVFTDYQYQKLYMYYLFYSRYDPRVLSREDVRRGRFGPVRFHRSFETLPDVGKAELFAVCDAQRCYAHVYSSEDGRVIRYSMRDR